MIKNLHSPNRDNTPLAGWALVVFLLSACGGPPAIEPDAARLDAATFDSGASFDASAPSDGGDEERDSTVPDSGEAADAALLDSGETHDDAAAPDAGEARDASLPGEDAGSVETPCYAHCGEFSPFCLAGPLSRCHAACDRATPAQVSAFLECSVLPPGGGLACNTCRCATSLAGPTARCDFSVP